MEMLRIAICDDEQIWHKKSKQLIESFASKMNYEVELVYFYTDTELFAYTGAPFDAVFMDIELEDANGIHVATAINEKWPDCAVLYVTNYLFYATDVYQSEHIYFVLKDQFEEKLPEMFKKLFHIREQAEEKLHFDLVGSSNRDLFVAPKDILYFERDKRRTYIHTIWGDYETWEKISDIETKLSTQDFVRCHNSYIIYLPAVREMNNTSITMKNGAKIVISRNYASHTREIFARWAVSEIL